MTKFKFMLCSLLALLLALPLQAGNGFVTQRDGQLWRDGQPYYFVGTCQPGIKSARLSFNNLTAYQLYNKPHFLVPSIP